MNLIDRQNKIISDFEKINSWEDRYKKLIELGKALGDLEDSLKTEESKVKGCQSQVWLHAKLSDNGTILFSGDSDALLVKGLLAMVLYIYSNSTPREILDSNAEFVSKIGLSNHLSPSRTNGLNSMLKQIKNYAIAFHYLINSKNN